ncbi:MAG: NAD(P)H-binding protein [Bacteriovoracaceae bacterium]|nr:NAD(P)H-binding protein [Bacteriovoracaceae bacterium]
MKKYTVAIAGASGFVGGEVLKRLSGREDIEIVALSRSERKSEYPNVRWVQCDLYSLLDVEKALQGVDEAYYLVHSMAPTSSLDQGEFQDYDLILSDNFARAAKYCGVKHIIYLGGIIPQRRDLSMHLRSRFEVEQTLRTYGIPVTALRAGMIVGREGSSFNIMVRLIHRLPLLLCPEWANTKTQPIDVFDVVESLVYCLKNNEILNRSFDIGGPDVLTYQDMLKETAQILGKKRCFLKFPFFSLNLSKFWVSLITGAPSDLVYPLVSSLKHTILVNKDQELKISDQRKIQFKRSLENALRQGVIRSSPHAFVLAPEIDQKKEVRSVSRLALPQDKRAEDVAFAYMRWLPRFFFPFLRVKVDGEKCSFFFPFVKEPLLIFERSPARSSVDRQLFYIRGGLLAKEMRRGRFEFREVLGGKYLIAAIHEYRPSLPWMVYRYTQAPLHFFVMKSFNRWLKNH